MSHVNGKATSVADRPIFALSMSRVPVIASFGPVVGGPLVCETDRTDPLEVLDAVLERDDQVSGAHVPGSGVGRSSRSAAGSEGAYAGHVQADK